MRAGNEDLTRAKLAKPKQEGGLFTEVLEKGNRFASSRGGQSFSRWLSPDGENGEERISGSVDISTEAGGTIAGEDFPAKPRSPSDDQKRLSRDPKFRQQSDERGSSNTMILDQVTLPFQPAAQIQGRSSGSYAGAGFFSKKHGSFTGFAKLQQEKHSLAGEVSLLTEIGPRDEARAPGSIDAVPPAECPRINNNSSGGRAVVQTPPECSAACESEIDHDQGVQRTEESLAESIRQGWQAGEGAGGAIQGATAEGHPELLQSSQLIGRGQELGNAEPVLTGLPEAGYGGVGFTTSLPVEAELGGGLGSGLQAGGAIEARLSQLMVAQLKPQLEGRGLVCRGKKQDLVARLVGAILEEGDLSNWEERLEVLDAGGWGNPSRALKRGAKRATVRGGSAREEAPGTSGVVKGSQKQREQDGAGTAGKASAKRKTGRTKQKRVDLAGGATSDSSDGEVQILGGASKRSLRSKTEKGDEGIAGQVDDALDTASEKSFNSNDLSDSDDDYKPQEEKAAVAAEAGADQSASEGEAESGDEERRPPGKRKRAVDNEKGQTRSKAKKVGAAGEPTSRLKGTKRNRTVLGPAEKKKPEGTKRAATAKRRAELQAVGWGGPVRAGRAAGKASGNFSSAGLPVRDNFVRQNINGRGGGRKRFTNGGRTSFRSKSGTRPFKRNWGKSRRGGKNGTRPTGRGAAPGSEEPGEGAGEGWGADEQPGLFKNEGWLPGSAADAGQPTRLEPLREPSIPCPVVDQAGRSPADVSELQSDAETEAAVQAARGDPSESNLLTVLQRRFDFDEFREGQLAAIQRVLAQRSTMLVLPTGAGKSLCYQVSTRVPSSACLFLGNSVCVFCYGVQLRGRQTRNLLSACSSSNTYRFSTNAVHKTLEAQQPGKAGAQLQSF